MKGVTLQPLRVWPSKSGVQALVLKAGLEPESEAGTAGSAQITVPAVQARTSGIRKQSKPRQMFGQAERENFASFLNSRSGQTIFCACNGPAARERLCYSAKRRSMGSCHCAAI